MLLNKRYIIQNISFGYLNIYINHSYNNIFSNFILINNKYCFIHQCIYHILSEHTLILFNNSSVKYYITTISCFIYINNFIREICISNIDYS